MPSDAPDRREIEALYLRYGALVRRRARAILGDDAAAEDATQDVFIRVLGSLASFRGDSQPSTWLYRVVTNLCLNRLRDGKRHRERLDELGSARAVAGAAQGASVEDRLGLQRLLAEVPAELAEAAVYYHIDELDQDEIAALTGVARRTVGYRLERFRELARQRLPGPDHEVAGTAATRPDSPRSR